MAILGLHDPRSCRDSVATGNSHSPIATPKKIGVGVLSRSDRLEDIMLSNLEKRSPCNRPQILVQCEYVCACMGVPYHGAHKATSL
jgi:hypothetical protein